MCGESKVDATVPSLQKQHRHNPQQEQDEQLHPLEETNESRGEKERREEEKRC